MGLLYYSTLHQWCFLGYGFRGLASKGISWGGSFFFLCNQQSVQCHSFSNLWFRFLYLGHFGCGFLIVLRHLLTINNVLDLWLGVDVFLIHHIRSNVWPGWLKPLELLPRIGLAKPPPVHQMEFSFLNDTYIRVLCNLASKVSAFSFPKFSSMSCWTWSCGIINSSMNPWCQC